MPHPKATYRPYRAPAGATRLGDTYDVVPVAGKLIWVDLRPGQDLGPPAHPGAAPTRVWHSTDGRRWTASGSAGFARLTQLGLTSSVVGQQVFLTGEVSNRDRTATDLVISRSDDGGATWHATTLDPSRSPVAGWAMVRSIGSRLVVLGAERVAGTATGAIPMRIRAWISSDLGETWRLLPASTFGDGYDAPLATGRTADARLLVNGVLGGTWTSRDGEHWTPVPLPMAGGKFSMRSLGGAALFATDLGPGETDYFSTDAGLHWQPLHLQRVPLADAAGSGGPTAQQLGRTGSTLWMQANGSPGSDSSSAALQRSDDGGRTWHDTGLARHLCGTSPSQPQMRIDPPVSVGSTLVVGATCVNPVFVGSAAVYISTDDGRRWMPVPLPGPVSRSALGPARVHGDEIRYDVRTEPPGSDGGPGMQDYGELVIRP